MSHGLVYWCPCYVSGPGDIAVALLSMESQRALGFNQKYLNLCSEDEQMSYGFGTTWGWVINDCIFVFGWTFPLINGCQFRYFISQKTSSVACVGNVSWTPEFCNRQQSVPTCQSKAPEMVCLISNGVYMAPVILGGNWEGYKCEWSFFFFVCKKSCMQELFTKWLLLCLEVYFEKVKN